LIARALPTLFNDAIEGQGCDSLADMNDYTNLSSDASQHRFDSDIAPDNDCYTDHCIQNINGTTFVCRVSLNRFICILFYGSN